ncbi:cytochrome b561 and DOMON domain-containing protein At5g47530-like isoform X2 [Salvia miltiorrhiza]|uniref:cytochrome b561 and DOMON domain-containing protein At5g47530-like isoform X2 n=1 Tax=Salvia miltiorrhiza TaxID=226208 RepID=UPI0025AD0557|nr:cytochrome b561 and DOMON domain-containing protein At5g47530-like isoform X2 [Salvia miltiorrhiza]
MNFPCLLLLVSIIWCAETSSSNESLHQETDDNHQQQVASLENRSNGITAGWQYHYYKHHALRTVHGTVNIVGWGVLLPTGVIVARYLRESRSNDWYNLHIITQFSGFLLGTLGWGIGISIKNQAKQQRMSTHGILGTLIFALATLQAYVCCLMKSTGAGDIGSSITTLWDMPSFFSSL